MDRQKRIWTWLLLPLTGWYAVGVFVRNLMFEVGIKRQEAPRVMTIGVGNMNVGGSGKTPMVEYLLSLLSSRHRTAMLSRGYGRKTKGFVLDDGSGSPQRLGDEVAMVSRKFPDVVTAVCERRVEGIHQLMAMTDAPELVVLDDVYQHRYVKPTVNILLTEYQHPFTRDHILPFGNLREFRSAKQRANIVVVTKCPETLPPVEKQNLVRELDLKPYQHLFFSCLDYGTPYRLTVDGRVDGEDNPLDAVDHVLLLTGIAHPAPLLRHVKSHCNVTHMAFGDHHSFTSRDLKAVVDKYQSLPGSKKILLTTEKDAARLSSDAMDFLLSSIPWLYVQPVTVRFLDQKGVGFDSMITSLVDENISFLNKLKTSKLING